MYSELSFKQEPRAEGYRVLVNEGAQVCSTFSLIERPDLQLESSAERLLDTLKPALSRQRDVSEWPGTKLFGSTAIRRDYVLNADTAALLVATVNGLYDWRQPSHLEDLIFWRREDTPWLVSIAHEQDAYLLLRPEEWRGLQERHPQLASLLIESGGGKA